MFKYFHSKNFISKRPGVGETAETKKAPPSAVERKPSGDGRIALGAELAKSQIAKVPDALEKFSSKIISRDQWGARPNRTLEDQTEYDEPLNEVYNSIVIHHSGHVYGSPKAIQDYHMDKRDYDDIAYHFVIGVDGKLYEGREIKYMGSHAGRSKETKEAKAEAKAIRAVSAMDSKKRKKLIDAASKKDPDFGSIGIVIDGNYDDRRLTPKQRETLVDLLAHLKAVYHITNERIIGHKHVKKKLVEDEGLTFIGPEKACPGNHVVNIIDDLKKQLPPDTEIARKKKSKSKK